MNRLPDAELTFVPGGTLITATPEEGRALAFTMARHSIHNIQPDLDVLKGDRPNYSTDPDSLIAASQVVAIEFQTIAAANDYWRHSGRTSMSFDDVVARVGQAIDAVGVAAIVVGAALALLVAADRVRRREADVYTRFRRFLGRSILLGLELLVAADIVRTVASKPTLAGVTTLAAIVVIRTFLSFSLELEITGRWPWQKGSGGASP